MGKLPCPHRRQEVCDTFYMVAAYNTSTIKTFGRVSKTKWMPHLFGICLLCFKKIVSRSNRSNEQQNHDQVF